MITKCDIKNLDCANCAAKIERHLKTLPEVNSVSVNFATMTLHIDTENLELIQKEIHKLEPGVFITPKNSQNASINPEHKHLPDTATLKAIAIMSIAFMLFGVQLIFEDFLHKTPWGVGEYIISVLAYLLAGWNVLKGALRTIRKGRLFDENVLMTIATIGAFAIHAISEAVGVMIFYKVGEFLQELAVSRSRRSIKALLEIRPDYANRKTANGFEKVPPDQIKPGEMILIKAGEKIPLDSVVVEGSSQVNTAAITGEALPVSVHAGASVLAGSINLSGLLTCRVTKIFSESSIAKILELVENATANKAKTEQFITRFARYYTPAVVILSLGVATIPPLAMGESFHTWIYRALVLLVISCPCALMVSIPLGYFGGIGGASRRGILVKGANFLDALASVRTVVFDKTGTLTKGLFQVQEIVTRNGFSQSQVLTMAAIAESHSNHPIAQSILQAAKIQGPFPNSNEITEHQEVPGYGVKVRTKSNTILVGNDAMFHRESIAHEACGETQGTVVFVAIDGVFAGIIQIGDQVKEDSKLAVDNLRLEGVDSIIMLTGDNYSAAQGVASSIGIDQFHAGLLPEDKLAHLNAISAERMAIGKIAFVGDGINDAPVLARADIGIAMGALGSDAAIETADVVLMTDHPSKVAEAIQIGKRTRNIIWQNIALALTVKVVFLSFGAFGLAGMWEAVFADMGTALLAVLNSTRALRT